jgi:tetratricopeptide (TPR) repeat protein
MGDLWIQVLTRTERDLQTLESLFGPKVMAEDVIGYERWIQAEPRSPALHDDVGVLYLRLNRADDAVRHFRISVELQPDLAAAHFNLGTALTVAERLDEATTEYQRALELKPDYARAHNNLGGILLHSGRLEDAIGHFEEAIRIDPENAEAHRNLGAARQQPGRMAAAITQYKRAVLLSANNWLPALTDLAWLLACADDDALRDPSLALRLAERAVALSDRRDAAALDVLGAGYAASAEFGKALEAAEAALALAPANASAIRERRDLYTRSRPYRLPER